MWSTTTVLLSKRISIWNQRWWKSILRMMCIARNSPNSKSATTQTTAKFWLTTWTRLTTTRSSRCTDGITVSLSLRSLPRWLLESDHLLRMWQLSLSWFAPTVFHSIKTIQKMSLFCMLTQIDISPPICLFLQNWHFSRKNACRCLVRRMKRSMPSICRRWHLTSWCWHQEHSRVKKHRNSKRPLMMPTQSSLSTVIRPFSLIESKLPNCSRSWKESLRMYSRTG